MLISFVGLSYVITAEEHKRFQSHSTQLSDSVSILLGYIAPTVTREGTNKPRHLGSVGKWYFEDILKGDTYDFMDTKLTEDHS